MSLSPFSNFWCGSACVRIPWFPPYFFKDYPFKHSNWLIKIGKTYSQNHDKSETHSRLEVLLPWINILVWSLKITFGLVNRLLPIGIHNCFATLLILLATGDLTKAFCFRLFFHFCFLISKIFIKKRKKGTIHVSMYTKHVQ